MSSHMGLWMSIYSLKSITQRQIIGQQKMTYDDWKHWQDNQMNTHRNDEVGWEKSIVRMM